jgi:3-oxoacyl-(acyl-carrier-protein) synthase
LSRVVVTGAAVNTPLGDTLDGVLDALVAGRSGIAPWRAFAVPEVGCFVGGDLTGYDARAKAASLRPSLPPEVGQRLERLLRRIPWSAQLSVCVAADAAIAARFWDRSPDPDGTAVLVAGHNLSPRYAHENWKKFQAEPDYLDALAAVHMPDTNHAACVSEVLGTRGAIGTVGAACASGNYALRAALDELAEGAACAVVVAPIYEYAPTTFQALGLMRATSEATAGEAARASRPFDASRDGFVPSHGAAALILEPLDLARERGAPLLAEVLAAEGGSDACHRPPRPSPPDQAALIRGVLDRAGISAGELDLVSAHAASTPAGDVAEAEALALALGEHGGTVPVNAAKSMLGHTGWSAALVEIALAVAQMRRGEVHGTANLSERDPAIGLRLGDSEARSVRTVLKNAFGFGGLNCVSVLRSVE